MASLNLCCFIGNVGNEPEIRYMPSGEAVANISLAVSETWKDKQGQKQDRTEWVKVSFFGALADVVSKYVHKGDPLYVSGQMKTRKWTDKDGQDRYSTEIRGDRLQMLGGKGDAQSEPKSANSTRAAMKAQAPDGFDSDEIPF